jgi:hypothetical protein
VSEPVKKPPVDWEAVERDYRTGQFTDRELGARYGVSHTAIQKRAKKHEWQKDLAGAVRVATQAKLVEHEVSKVASSAVAKQVAKQVAKAIPATTEVVAAMAEVRSGVEIRHRDDLRAIRDVALAMLAELQQTGEHSDTLDQIAEMLGGSDDEKPDENKLRQALQRAISLPSRITGIKALADTLTKLIDAERVTFRLDDPDQGDNAGRTLTDAERASRLATILERARQKANAVDVEPA